MTPETFYNEMKKIRTEGLVVAALHLARVISSASSRARAMFTGQRERHLRGTRQ